KTLLALEALNRLRDCVETCQGMQRAAVMAGRHFGGTGHRERRGGQHRLSRDPGTQFFEGPIQDLTRRRVLDELDQRLDRGGIFDSSPHRHRGVLLTWVLCLSW